MIRIFKTVDGKLEEVQQLDHNCWADLIHPTPKEMEKVAQFFDIEMDFLKAALNKREVSRYEKSVDGKSLLLTLGIPKLVRGTSNFSYETIPVAIIQTENGVVTVCEDHTEIIEEFVNGDVIGSLDIFSAHFVLQILEQCIFYYFDYLIDIRTESIRIEAKLKRSTKNRYMFEMMELENSLIYFSHSLKSAQEIVEAFQNESILLDGDAQRGYLKKIGVEINQAVAMCEVYTSVLNNLTNTSASVVSNNLNIVMKILTAITILMTIPTIISSWYGMNVSGLPFAQFWPVTLLTAVVTGVTALLLWKFKMFS